MKSPWDELLKADGPSSEGKSHYLNGYPSQIVGLISNLRFFASHFPNGINRPEIWGLLCR